jgi:hypothetical protein
MDLKKIAAAEVARAICQMVQPSKSADVSYVLKSFGGVSPFVNLLGH